MKKQSIASTLVAAGALCIAGAAHGQAAGDVMVKLGWNKIIPHVKSGDLSAPSLPDSQINIKSASALYFTGTYMVTDNFAIEALAGLPYKHKVVGAGAVSAVGQIGTIHQVSPTVLAEWRFFAPTDQFRPYVGIGPTFAKFYKTTGSAALTALTNPGGSGTTIGGDTEWGLSTAAGANYKIDKHWSVEAAIFKVFIKTQTTLSTGQSIKANLNPVAINAAVGYTF